MSSKPRPERRRACRHRSDWLPALLGWWDTEEAFQSAPALILDVSQGGVRLHVEARPPIGPAFLWPTGHSDHWIDLQVLALEPLPRGRSQARARFAHACPYDLFRAAVHGLSLAGCAVAATGAEQDDARFWR